MINIPLRKSLFCLVLLGLITTTQAQSADCENPISGDLSAAPEDITALLNKVSKQFCKQQMLKNNGWKTLKVTSVQRTAKAQAGYIQSCLAKGCVVYENQQAIEEYQSLAVKNKKTIETTIKDQINRNCYISKHLSNRAVDIGTAGHSKKEIEKLKQILLATPYLVDDQSYTVLIEDRSHGTGPHLHLNFRPYSFIPDQCPRQ